MGTHMMEASLLLGCLVLLLIPVNSLKCHMCIGNDHDCSPTEVTCPGDSDQCSTTALHIDSFPCRVRNIFMGCINSTTTSKKISVSPSPLVTLSLQQKLCDSDLCNTQGVSDPDTNVNGLHCYSCISPGTTCNSDMMRQMSCMGEQNQCVDMKVTGSFGDIADVNIKGCAHIPSCNQNLEFSSQTSAVSVKCCNGNFCNSGTDSESEAKTPNGVQCYSCNTLDGASCSHEKVVKAQCYGDLTQCLEVAGTSVKDGRSLPTVIKGCATPSMCNTSVLPMLQKLGSATVKCCNGSLCNDQLSESSLKAYLPKENASPGTGKNNLSVSSPGGSALTEEGVSNTTTYSNSHGVPDESTTVLDFTSYSDYSIIHHDNIISTTFAKIVPTARIDDQSSSPTVDPSSIVSNSYNLVGNSGINIVTSNPNVSSANNNKTSGYSVDTNNIDSNAHAQGNNGSFQKFTSTTPITLNSDINQQLSGYGTNTYNTGIASNNSSGNNISSSGNNPAGHGNNSSAGTASIVSESESHTVPSPINYSSGNINLSVLSPRGSGLGGEGTSNATSFSNGYNDSIPDAPPTFPDFTGYSNDGIVPNSYYDNNMNYPNNNDFSSYVGFTEIVIADIDWNNDQSSSPTLAPDISNSSIGNPGGAYSNSDDNTFLVASPTVSDFTSYTDNSIVSNSYYVNNMNHPNNNDFNSFEIGGFTEIAFEDIDSNDDHYSSQTEASDISNSGYSADTVNISSNVNAKGNNSSTQHLSPAKSKTHNSGIKQHVSQSGTNINNMGIANNNNISSSGHNPAESENNTSSGTSGSSSFGGHSNMPGSNHSSPSFGSSGTEHGMTNEWTNSNDSSHNMVIPIGSNNISSTSYTDHSNGSNVFSNFSSNPMMPNNGYTYGNGSNFGSLGGSIESYLNHMSSGTNNNGSNPISWPNEVISGGSSYSYEMPNNHDNNSKHFNEWIQNNSFISNLMPPGMHYNGSSPPEYNINSIYNGSLSGYFNNLGNSWNNSIHNLTSVLSGGNNEPFNISNFSSGWSNIMYNPNIMPNNNGSSSNYNNVQNFFSEVIGNIHNNDSTNINKWIQNNSFISSLIPPGMHYNSSGPSGYNINSIYNGSLSGYFNNLGNSLNNNINNLTSIFSGGNNRPFNISNFGSGWGNVMYNPNLNPGSPNSNGSSNTNGYFGAAGFNSQPNNANGMFSGGYNGVSNNGNDHNSYAMPPSENNNGAYFNIGGNMGHENINSSSYNSNMMIPGVSSSGSSYGGAGTDSSNNGYNINRISHGLNGSAMGNGSHTAVIWSNDYVPDMLVPVRSTNDSSGGGANGSGGEIDTMFSSAPSLWTHSVSLVTFLAIALLVLS